MHRWKVLYPKHHGDTDSESCKSDTVIMGHNAPAASPPQMSLK